MRWGRLEERAREREREKGGATIDCSRRMNEQRKRGRAEWRWGTVEREKGGKRRGWEGRRHLLTAEPFIDKVAPGWARRLQLDTSHTPHHHHHARIHTLPGCLFTGGISAFTHWALHITAPLRKHTHIHTYTHTHTHTHTNHTVTCSYWNGQQHHRRLPLLVLSTTLLQGCGHSFRRQQRRDTCNWGVGVGASDLGPVLRRSPRVKT